MFLPQRNEQVKRKRCMVMRRESPSIISSISIPYIVPFGLSFRSRPLWSSGKVLASGPEGSMFDTPFHRKSAGSVARYVIRRVAERLPALAVQKFPISGVVLVI
ncbi:hypothetical protein AVEN_267500-1 [Araneus ventricosus]|uniref:Uncharacterized protein n=1 Tax=Araneus ventricosus TaxID=182803 RepID=A0A4Y2WH61_ARAVE|nr:hypothetical protein AVEN_15367-1 [Araneus ventricosus]GBO36519.1 hypothetical protein AVEN_267500-1 [Araneus ventricosus]